MNNSKPLAMTCGYRVFVCSNMAFAGDFTPVLAKHSKSFSLIDCIAVGVDRMQRSFEPMRQQVEAWQRSEVTDVTAKVVIYEAFNWNWTRGFFEEIARKGLGQLDRIYGWALHHYVWNLSRGRTQDWAKANGDALNFDAVDWYELLRQGDRMEGLIEGHWQVMGETDHEHKVKLVVDEWGPWYKPGSQANPNDFLEQMPTIRDAVFSGMTLDIFNRHPEKVAMANCAQRINCLNSLFLAHEDKFVVTPVGHIFGMYAGHHNGQGVRSLFSSPAISYQRDGQPATFWGLKGSATLHDKTLFLTVVNPHVTQPRETEIRLRGASARAVRATVLEAADIHAHNTFDQRNNVVPQSKDVKGSYPFVFTFPAASVTALRVELA